MNLVHPATVQEIIHQVITIEKFQFPRFQSNYRHWDYTLAEPRYQYQYK